MTLKVTDTDNLYGRLF